MVKFVPKNRCRSFLLPLSLSFSYSFILLTSFLLLLLLLCLAIWIKNNKRNIGYIFSQFLSVPLFLPDLKFTLWTSWFKSSYLNFSFKLGLLSHAKLCILCPNFILGQITANIFFPSLSFFRSFSDLCVTIPLKCNLPWPIGSGTRNVYNRNASIHQLFACLTLTII